MTAPRAFECVGEIAVGRLSPETQQRLAHLGGEWLEYSSDEEAIVVRHTQPGGTPALSAVPAELIGMLDALDPAERESVAGGALLVRDREGPLLRLVADRQEIRIQWPQEDWSHAVPVPLEELFRAVEPVSARITGRIRFSAPAGAETRLVDFVERFEGLYPERDLAVERAGAMVTAELRGVNVGPVELLGRLRELARPLDSLDGELEVGSFHPHAVERDFRLKLRGGSASAERPALWR